MKKFFALFATCFVFSCQNKEVPSEVLQSGALQQLNLPEWVINTKVDGVISSVGIAPRTLGGLKMQIAQATEDAKANMASEIQTKVSRVTKDSMRRAGVINKGEKQEAIDEYFAQATKSIVKNVPISGAKRTNMWQDPATGDLYIQMILDQTNVKEYLVQSADTFANGLQGYDVTQKTIAQTERAMKDLFDEMDFSSQE